jgi:hypothetical protein
MVLDFGMVEKGEGGHLDTPVLQGAVEVEVPLIAVEPQHKIVSAVKFGKFDFVQRVGPIDDVLTITVCPPASDIVMRVAPGRWRCDRSIPGC